jgi:hypothetical protein
MRTSILAFALTAVAPVIAQAQSPTWHTDYGTAQQNAKNLQKPLALVFGQGTNGWQQLGGGTIPAAANATLGDSYVCLHVDTATPDGRSLAEKFEIKGSIGIVLSDRTGGLQAFWHQGVMSADALAACLSRYADPNHSVITTETNSSPITYYPPNSPFAGNSYPPSGAAPVCRT